MPSKHEPAMNPFTKLLGVVSAAPALHPDHDKLDLTPRERVLAYRRRERRPPVHAKVVAHGRYFDRLSNGMLVRAGSVG